MILSLLKHVYLYYTTGLFLVTICEANCVYFCTLEMLCDLLGLLDWTVESTEVDPLREAVYIRCKPAELFLYLTDTPTARRPGEGRYM